NWTPAGPDFLTAFPADAANTGFATAPGVTVPVTHSLDVGIPSGANFYLAWNYSVATGSTTTNAQALAIDDVNITGVAGVTPEVAPAVTTTRLANGARTAWLHRA